MSNIQTICGITNGYPARTPHAMAMAEVWQHEGTSHACKLRPDHTHHLINPQLLQIILMPFSLFLRFFFM